MVDSEIQFKFLLKHLGVVRNHELSKRKAFHLLFWARSSNQKSTMPNTGKQSTTKSELPRARPNEVDVKLDSAQAVSPNSEDCETSQNSHNRKPVTKTKEAVVVGEVAEKYEKWEDLPDLVEELRSTGKFTYITKQAKHREFELAGKQNISSLCCTIVVVNSHFEIK